MSMKLGISTWVYLNYTIDEALRRLAKTGFHILELWADQAQLDPRIFPEHALSKVHELGRSLKLVFRSLHAPFTNLDIASLDEAKKEMSIQWVSKAFTYASKLGCPYVVLHPGSGESMTVIESESEVKGRLLDTLQRVGKAAEGSGVKVLLENMTQRGNRRYCSSIRELVELVQALGGDVFSICFDPGHTLISGYDVYEELREAKGFLFSLHVNDNDRVKDLHLVPSPLKGLIHWNRFLRVLRNIEYNGPFMLEVYGGENPDEVVADARALIDKFPSLQL